MGGNKYQNCFWNISREKKKKKKTELLSSRNGSTPCKDPSPAGPTSGFLDPLFFRIWAIGYNKIYFLFLCLHSVFTPSLCLCSCWGPIPKAPSSSHIQPLLASPILHLLSRGSAPIHPPPPTPHPPTVDGFAWAAAFLSSLYSRALGKGLK